MMKLTQPNQQWPLLRQLLLHRFRLHNCQWFTLGTVVAPHRLWCSAATPGTNPNLSSPEQQATDEASSVSMMECRKWKDKEEEILRDIEPIVMLTKDILHSSRYKEGERLTAEDEKIVVDKLLAYHPHSEDKIGCGLESIMVDRHPQFRHSRCLFVVRTDGGWIDFSYKKCLQEYIRDKYPTHAEMFVREHFKRGSG